ncbi:MAG: imidazole glycerol phosphate synthase subunit HisH, partial [Chloroflexi bacterium]|nr:imidazole glycerol phosphate synthase subunit HisH [Chloroflexota bacterium]
MTRSLPVAVVDYGAGNLRSVAKALECLGAAPWVTSDPDQVLASPAVVLPGVGSCDAAMRALQARSLTEAVREAILRGKPFFGVCLGLQLLFDSSEEGEARCLGIIPGSVKRLPVGLKVPHMGWNQMEITTNHPVFAGARQGGYYYFV